MSIRPALTNSGTFSHWPCSNSARTPRVLASASANSTSNPTGIFGFFSSGKTYGPPPFSSPPQRSTPASRILSSSSAGADRPAKTAATPIATTNSRTQANENRSVMAYSSFSEWFRLQSNVAGTCQVPFAASPQSSYLCSFAPLVKRKLALAWKFPIRIRTIDRPWGFAELFPKAQRPMSADAYRAASF